MALPDRLPPDPPQAGDSRDAGHLVKARYTPLQPILLGVDEEASPHHDRLAAADTVDGMPVVTADLHSALPAILAGVRADAPDARVAYVLTDGGALPAWFSRTLAGLAGHLVGTVSVGQAFGGDLEANTAQRSARRPARARCGPDDRRPGPGNLGTGTRWGFSGVAVGEAVNAIAALGGARSARCASPTPTPGPGTVASPPQPDRVRPGRAGPRRTGRAGRPRLRPGR
ncbi:DUF3866 family protein [Micromonospora sp. BRA006-A]|nr:DUF3866 family protein [Micromonospora sp. BRA006-A]